MMTNGFIQSDFVGHFVIPPVGFHVEWRRDDRWVTGEGLVYGQCRRTSGGAVRCSNPAVARLKRGKRWWAYCAAHLYGRRLRNGVVEMQILVKDGDPK